MTGRPHSQVESAGRAAARRELAARAWDAYRDGPSRTPPVEVDLDAHFNAKYLLAMAERLSLPEISCLLEASRAREEGLGLCRDGHDDEAEARLTMARDLLGDERLSEEAKAVGDSFQLAAEAYLWHRRGDWAAARMALLEALALCRELRERYGYEVEVRRVHLARNVVRVEATARSEVAALHMALDLASYLDGEVGAWPFPDLALPEPSLLTMDEKRALMSQVWSELSRLLSGANERAARLWRDERLIGFRLSEEGGLQQLTAWLEATRALRAKDVDLFLARVREFFAHGPVIEDAWRDLAQTFTDVSAPWLGNERPAR